MKRISSNLTFAFRDFSILIFQIIAAAASVIFLLILLLADEFPWELIPAAGFFALIFLILAKVQPFGVMSEVFDCGDSLVLKRDRKEERVLLSNIEAISHAPYSVYNCPLVFLTLREETVFGKYIEFVPTKSIGRIATPDFLKDLEHRIKKADGSVQK